MSERLKYEINRFFDVANEEGLKSYTKNQNEGKQLDVNATSSKMVNNRCLKY